MGHLNYGAALLLDGLILSHLLLSIETGNPIWEDYYAANVIESSLVLRY